MGDMAPYKDLQTGRLLPMDLHKSLQNLVGEHGLNEEPDLLFNAERIINVRGTQQRVFILEVDPGGRISYNFIT